MKKILFIFTLIFILTSCSFSGDSTESTYEPPVLNGTNLTVDELMNIYTVNKTTTRYVEVAVSAVLTRQEGDSVLTLPVIHTFIKDDSNAWVLSDQDGVYINETINGCKELLNVTLDNFNFDYDNYNYVCSSDPSYIYRGAQVYAVMEYTSDGSKEDLYLFNTDGLLVQITYSNPVSIDSTMKLARHGLAYKTE